MSDITPQQIQRDNFLRSLGIAPGRALRQWKHLNWGEQTVVVTYMTMFYDTNFATHFMAEANRRQRPDLTITITNNPEWVNSPLKSKPAREWKLQRTVGDVKIWVHPTGDELWLLPAPKAVEPPDATSPPGGRTTPSPETHPDVQDAHNWADNLEARRDDLWAAAIRLQQMKNPDGSYPQGPFNAYYSTLNKFNDDLNSVLNDEAPQWGAGMTADENTALQHELDRLKKLQDSPPEMKELE